MNPIDNLNNLTKRTLLLSNTQFWVPNSDLGNQPLNTAEAFKGQSDYVITYQPERGGITFFIEQ